MSRPLWHDERGGPQSAPVIAYGLDQGGTVAFLDGQDVEQSAEEVHAQALDHLRTALADHPGWREADFSGAVDGSEVLEYGGHYYSAEAILLPEILRQAQRRLGGDDLVAATPARGHLYVMRADVDAQALQQFVIACIAKHYQAESAPVSPVIWRLQDGVPVGYLEGTESIETYVREQIEQTRQAQQDRISLQEAVTEDPDGKTLHLLFYTEDPQLLLDAIQQSVRRLVQTQAGNGELSGRIIAVIALTPTLKANRGLLTEQMEGMVPFLNAQIRDLGLGPRQGLCFELSYRWETDI
ncbi:MAG: hypothetical protein SXV54_03255 [Chloroflexota bacterium]|nr:hypothetical protein [Chloroflexota bacterium]